MPFIETTEELTTLAHSLVIAVGKGILTADMIVAAAMPASGVARGEDMLSVLNRKLDDGTLIASGSALPLASETARPIFYRTDERAFYFKQRTGAAAPYTYSWLGPVDKGDYQLRLIYHTAAAPAAPVISWNWQNETFNVTGGGWTLDTANAKWMRIVALPADSNAASVSPAVRLGAVTASDVSVIAPDGDGHLPSSISNLQELTNWIDNDAQFGGTSTAAQSDELLQVIKYEAPSSPPTFQAVASYVEQTFSIDADLRDYQTTFGEQLFAEAVADLNIQGTNDAGDMSVRFEFRDSAGAVLSPPVGSDLAFTVPGTTQETHHRVRCAGVLPANFTGGSWRVTVLTNAQDSPKLGWVAETRIDVHPEVAADEVTVDAADYGNNLLAALTLNNVGDAISQIDELPLAFADYEDAAWVATGVDIGGALNQRQMDIPIHQKIQDVNARPTQQFIANILYDVNYISGSRTDGGTTATYRHEVRSDADSYASVLSTHMATQGVTPTRVRFDVAVPSGATRLRVTFAEPLDQANTPIDQADARLNVANYRLDYEKGIDTTSFTSPGRLLDTNAGSLRTVAAQLYGWQPNGANIAIDASGFDGLLGTGDTDVQKLAQKVDDLRINAGSTGIDATQFSDPSDFIGGLREPLPSGITQSGLVASPANVQQALVKIDYLLQLAYNPYQYTQNLDRLVASVITEDFTVVGTGDAISNAIDIPELFRDISQDLIVRVRAHAATEPSTFRGRLRLIAADSTTPVSGTTAVSINGSLASQAQGQDIVFQTRIAAAHVPNTFRIRFEGTSTNTATATFNQGHVYLEVASAAAASQPQGQADYTRALIWVAGGTLTSRLTGSAHQTLLSGHTWSQYDLLQWNFDNGTQAGMLLPMLVDANLFRATASYGTMKFTDLVGFNVRPVGSGDNQFQFRWSNRGLRSVLGISIR